MIIRIIEFLQYFVHHDISHFQLKKDKEEIIKNNLNINTKNCIQLST